MSTADRNSGRGREGGGGGGGSGVTGTSGESSSGGGARASWRSSRLWQPPAADDFGFVSKGDMRLLDKKNQEKFFGNIVEKYIKFCGSTDGSSDLVERLASLSIPDPPAVPTPPSGGPPPSTNARFADSNNAGLTSILLSMRKLREGIIGAKRIDAFSSKAYMFMIRTSILMRHPESYHPALRHLLYDIHPYVPLSSNERQEFAGYLILHLASSAEAYIEAWGVKQEFKVTDYRILQAIAAMVHGNYWSFRATRRKVDLYKARLMESAERRMREHTLKCIAKAYFKVEVDYVEAVTGMSWDGLKQDFAVGWEVEGGIATVRKQKTRQIVKPTVQLDVNFKAW